MKNTENNITSSTAVVTEGQSTDTASLSNMAKVTIASILMAAASPTFTSCETDKGVDPVEQVDPNKLTAEQQAFADKLAPNKDGTPKSITIDIGNPSSPFYMPKLFRIELKLVNAKAGTLEITPYISKAPIANALKNAEIAEPGKPIYGTGISLVIKKIDGTTSSPTSTQVIESKDDNNPSTIDPYLALMPDIFTFDEFNKYISQGATKLPKSIIINNTDELQISIETLTIGKQFEKIRLPIKPVEISAIQNTDN